MQQVAFVAVANREGKEGSGEAAACPVPQSTSTVYLPATGEPIPAVVAAAVPDQTYTTSVFYKIL